MAIPRSVQKVVLCSGKHYYALLKQRETSAANRNTALIRVEELCPFPLEALQQELQKYPNAKGASARSRVGALREAPGLQSAFKYVRDGASSQWSARAPASLLPLSPYFRINWYPDILISARLFLNRMFIK